MTSMALEESAEMALIDKPQTIADFLDGEIGVLRYLAETPTLDAHHDTGRFLTGVCSKRLVNLQNMFWAEVVLPISIFCVCADDSRF